MTTSNTAAASKHKIVLVALIAATLIAVSGWHATGPRRALLRAQEAIVQGDAERLQVAVDFPAVQQDIMEQVRKELIQEAQKQGGDEDLTTGFAVAALALFEQILRQVVTAEGVIAMHRGQQDAPPEYQQDIDLLNTRLETHTQWSGPANATVVLASPRGGAVEIETAWRAGQWQVVGLGEAKP